MRRTIVAVTVIVVLLIAAIAYWRHRPSSPPAAARTSQAGPAQPVSPAKNTAASQQELEADLIAKGNTSERAELLFRVVIGPLPGVDIPAGFSPSPGNFDGTLAITALYQVRQSLTPDQVQAVMVRLAAACLQSAWSLPSMNRCSAPHSTLPIEVVVFGDDPPRNGPAAARCGFHALQFVDAHPRHDVIALGIPCSMEAL